MVPYDKDFVKLAISAEKLNTKGTCQILIEIFLIFWHMFSVLLILGTGAY